MNNDYRGFDPCLSLKDDLVPFLTEISVYNQLITDRNNNVINNYGIGIISKSKLSAAEAE